jgi:hypothetical protein
MGNRKLVEAPVEDGPVKAKGGPIGTPEETKDPIVRDPPSTSPASGDGAPDGGDVNP